MFHAHAPDCVEWTYDAYGFPLARTVEEGDRWSFVYAGRRVVRMEVDQVEMCVENDYGDEGQCGPRDGRPDSVSEIVWSEDGTRMTVGPPDAPHIDLRFDGEGRLVERRESGITVTHFEHEGAVVVRTRQLEHGVLREEHTMELDANGRMARHTLTSAGRAPIESRHAYDAHGHPLELASTRWEHTLDDEGHAIRSEITYSSGHVVVERRFENGWVVEERFAGDPSVVGSVVRIVTERGPRGRVLRRIYRGPDGAEWTRDYTCLPQGLWDALAR